MGQFCITGRRDTELGKCCITARRDAEMGQFYTYTFFRSLLGYILTASATARTTAENRAIMSLLTTPMTAEDIVFEKAKLSVDLSFLFDKTQIPPEVQAKFAALGYTDIMVFAQAEETGPLLREMIKKDVGLNPDTS
jgi:hypothetical protein